MERKEVIERLKQLRLDYTEFWEEIKNETTEALDYAISSLETDEAYQLDYESTTKNDLGVDCIDRQATLNAIIKRLGIKNETYLLEAERAIYQQILAMPPVTPQEPRKGEWLRMSDLSEQEDDRYKCSCCGNVVHYTNKMNLYTFNSWCGRCGSDNGRHINCEVGGRMNGEIIDWNNCHTSEQLESISAHKNDLGVNDEERKLALMYLEQMKEDYIEGVGYERHPLPEYYAIETAIKSLASPSVTPQEPKTGYWYIDERPESNREVTCSNCDQPIFKYHRLDFDYRPKYCPNCGARMVEPQESEG